MGMCVETSPSYSKVIGFVYIFNLIVGTAVLTMPRVFQLAGWVWSLVVVYVLALMGYMSASFVVETMSIANGRTKLEDNNADPSTDLVSSTARFSVGLRDDTPLLDDDIRLPEEKPSPFEITKKFEFCEMVTMFMPWPFLPTFYASFCVYLYGVLAMSAVGVSKTIRDLVCDYGQRNESDYYSWEERQNDTNPCWSYSPHMTRQHAYWICLAGFAVCLVPFAFFNIPCMKYLQVWSTILRGIALLMMIILSMIALCTPPPPDMDPLDNPMFELSHLTTPFGVCVYAFMWQHTLPGVIAPIRDKRGIQLMLLADFALIMGVYMLLSGFAVFTFPRVQDLYTLNFNPRASDRMDDRMPEWPVVDYFLTLYPVFTLSTNFPLVAITLQENMKVLVKQIICLYNHLPVNVASESEIVLPRWLEMVVFPFLAVLPSLALALWTDDLIHLAGFTGAYAGTILHYLFPPALVWSARTWVRQNFPGKSFSSLHIPRSLFFHRGFAIGLFVWGVPVILLSTAHFIIPKTEDGQ